MISVMARKKRGPGRPKMNPGDRKGDLLQVRVPPGLVERVKKALGEEGSVSSLVREQLEAWLAKREGHS